MSTVKCTLCSQPGHRASHCKELFPPDPNEFFNGGSTQSHSHDGEEEDKQKEKEREKLRLNYAMYLIQEVRNKYLRKTFSP